MHWLICGNFTFETLNLNVRESTHDRAVGIGGGGGACPPHNLHKYAPYSYMVDVPVFVVAPEIVV